MRPRQTPTMTYSATTCEIVLHDGISPTTKKSTTQRPPMTLWPECRSSTLPMRAEPSVLPTNEMKMKDDEAVRKAKESLPEDLQGKRRRAHGGLDMWNDPVIPGERGKRQRNVVNYADAGTGRGTFAGLSGFRMSDLILSAVDEHATCALRAAAACAPDQRWRGAAARRYDWCAS